MTQSRRAPVQQHRSRPPQTMHSKRPEQDEEEKLTYIEFINKLMHRMRIDSIKRMLDAALDELD